MVNASSVLHVNCARAVMLQWLLKIDRLVLWNVHCLRMYPSSCADNCQWGAELSLYRQSGFTKRLRSKEQDYCANLWAIYYRTAAVTIRRGSVRCTHTMCPGNDKVALEKGNNKDQVEGPAGLGCRNFMVPTPRFAHWGALSIYR